MKFQSESQLIPKAMLKSDTSEKSEISYCAYATSGVNLVCLKSGSRGSRNRNLFIPLTPTFFHPPKFLISKKNFRFSGQQIPMIFLVSSGWGVSLCQPQ